MGFNVNILGLNGEQRTSAFGVMRNRPGRPPCQHKGVDFSSSQKPKDFLSGIYGKVIPPTESGNWGTIAIQPFHAPEFTVQYLHCSEIYVGIGQIVYPWTRIGATGDVAPPGGSDGIHLHLQVFTSGTPDHVCWGTGRNFVDPENWDISNHLSGTWYSNDVNVVQGATIENNRRIVFTDDTVGASISGESRTYATMISPRTGKLYSIEQKSFWKGIISNRWQDGLQIEVFKGTCTVTSNPPTNQTCTANPSSFVLKMTSQNQIKAENTGHVWSKIELSEKMEHYSVEKNTNLLNFITNNNDEETNQLLNLLQQEIYLNI